MAKSKPCSLRGGWGSAGGSELTWHVGEDFAAWWEEAIVGGGVLAEQACCKGGEGGMSKEGGPSRNEGSGDGLAQGVWALARSGFGELADEPCCFFAPTASCFNSKNDQAAATWMDKFWARPFFGPSPIRSAVPACGPLCCRGAAWLVRGETMVVSMANWRPPQRGKPFAMTSIRRLSMRWTVGMLS